MIDPNILYSECPCGSGKKFKFCCYPVVRDDLPGDPTRADVTDAIRQRSAAKRLVEQKDTFGVLDLDHFHELIGRGLFHLNSGDYRQAEDILLQAREQYGMFPTAYNNLALCALVQGHLDEAEALVANYLLPQRIHPDAYLAWMKTLVTFYEKTGDRECLRNTQEGIKLVTRQLGRR